MALFLEKRQKAMRIHVVSEQECGINVNIPQIQVAFHLVFPGFDSFYAHLRCFTHFSLHDEEFVCSASSKTDTFCTESCKSA